MNFRVQTVRSMRQRMCQASPEHSASGTEVAMNAFAMSCVTVMVCFSGSLVMMSSRMDATLAATVWPAPYLEMYLAT